MMNIEAINKRFIKNIIIEGMPTIHELLQQGEDNTEGFKILVKKAEILTDEANSMLRRKHEKYKKAGIKELSMEELRDRANINIYGII